MPETPEELYERVKDSLRMPPVEEWDTFPFDGDMRPRDLLPPVEKEKPRFGEGGVDCRRCQASDDDYIWTSEHWRVMGWPTAFRSWSSSSRKRPRRPRRYTGRLLAESA